MKDNNEPTEDITTRRVILTAGGKGGVGKTVVALALTDFLRETNYDLLAFDADSENSRKGGLSSFYPDCEKVTIRGDRGLDAVLTRLLESKARIGVVDLPAGSSCDAFPWFSQMGDGITELGFRVTLVCAVTANPAAIQSLFNWSGELQTRVQYLVVRNERDGTEFRYLDETAEGKLFFELAQPRTVTLSCREADIQAELDNRGLSLGQALSANRERLGPDLSRAVDLIRMRRHHQFFRRQLDSVSDILFP